MEQNRRRTPRPLDVLNYGKIIAMAQGKNRGKPLKIDQGFRTRSLHEILRSGFVLILFGQAFLRKRTSLYIRSLQRKSGGMNLDTNIWGLLAMPLGVLLCFGPVLVLWIKEERRSKSEQEQGKANTRSQKTSERH